MVLKKINDIRLICHYFEYEPNIASITTIAVPYKESEAGQIFLNLIKTHDQLCIDSKEIVAQPRWALSYMFSKSYNESSIQN